MNDAGAFPGLCRAVRALLLTVTNGHDSGGLGHHQPSLFRLRSFGFFSPVDLGNFPLFYPLTNLHSSSMGSAAHDSLIRASPTEMVITPDVSEKVEGQGPRSRPEPELRHNRTATTALWPPRVFPPCPGPVRNTSILTWRLQVYRCHYLHNVLGPLEGSPLCPGSQTCHACLVNYYPDASVQQYLAVALGMPDLGCSRGTGQSPGRSMQPENVLSLGAVLESRHWLGGSNR